MTRPALPETIVNNVTAGHNAHAAALAKDYNLGAPMNAINALDPQNGILGDGSNEAPALNALYADAVADKLPLWFPPPPVAYGYGSDLLWDSNLVSVLGAGATAVPFQAIGTAKIIARPDPFTIDQGPTFRGFSVHGDPASPAGATGIYSGDITAARWEDLVIKGFKGAGSIGLHFDNVVGWTEVQRFRSVRLDDNTVCLLCSVSGGSNSFARIAWDCHFNLYANQVGFKTTNDALLYEQKGYFDGNAVGNDAVFVDMYGTSSISGVIDMDFEQTTGTGAIGIREFNPGFQFFARGVRNYTETMPEDIGGGKDLLQLPGGLRIKEGLSNSRMGAVALGSGADPAGQATVTTTAVKDAAEGQRIQLTSQLGAGVRGHRLEIGTRTPGESFVIRSVDAAGTLVADTSIIAWEIVERY
jgi:hypothetical protein